MASQALRPFIKRFAQSWAHQRRSISAVIPDSDAIQIANPPGLRVVDIHRPDVHNTLNCEMLDCLLPLLRDWQQDGDVKLAVLRGSGTKAFCIGRDIRFLGDAVSGSVKDRHKAYRFFSQEYSLNHIIAASKVPVVSILEGIIMGDGVGLAVNGAVRVATEKTFFAMPETSIGFFPDAGASWFLPRLMGNIGLFLGLTGLHLRGADTYAAGIATHFVPSDMIPACEGVIAEFGRKALSDNTKVDVMALSAALNALDRLDPVRAEEAPPSVLKVHADEINKCFDHQNISSIIRAVELRAENAISAGEGNKHWSCVASEALARASPTSLAVTLEMFRRGRLYSTLGECLEMEYLVAQRFVEHPDLKAGINEIMSAGESKAVWGKPPGPEQIASFFEAGEGGVLSL